MQPEIDIKHEQKGEPKISARSATPAELWDQVAYKLIGDILAPDGFKKINSGAFRGSQIAKSPPPGISKGQVGHCQKIAAQMVRTYREKLRKQLNSVADESNKRVEKSRSIRDACHFWQFRKKRIWQNQYRIEFNCAAIVRGILYSLDEIGIK